LVHPCIFYKYKVFANKIKWISLKSEFVDPCSKWVWNIVKHGFTNNRELYRLLLRQWTDRDDEHGEIASVVPPSK
jgi:hypothetical protein